MITIISKAFQVGDHAYVNIVDAQKAEIISLHDNSNVETPQDAETLAHWIVSHKDELLDILTTTTKSRPRARKVNGGTKKRVLIQTSNSGNVPVVTQTL